MLLSPIDCHGRTSLQQQYDVRISRINSFQKFLLVTRQIKISAVMTFIGNGKVCPGSKYNDIRLGSYFFGSLKVCFSRPRNCTSLIKVKRTVLFKRIVCIRIIEFKPVHIRTILIPVCSAFKLYVHLVYPLEYIRVDFRSRYFILTPVTGCRACDSRLRCIIYFIKIELYNGRIVVLGTRINVNS